MKGFISKDLHPVFMLLLLLGFMLAGVFVAYFFYSILVDFIFGIDMLEFVSLSENPAAHPNGKNAMIMFQGIVQFFSFILAPLFLIAATGHNVGHYLNWKERPWLLLLLLSGLLIIFIMPANSVIISWNANMNLPDFMSGFEQWAKAKEDELRDLTMMITQFDSVGTLLIGLLVFAVIPAIGEELVFRGVVQRNLHTWTGNPHVAIWIAAIVFGAIHVQFYGMLPRTLLGALFGYLYFWSGRISIPIIAHFVNNGFTVFLLYLQQTKTVDFDVESTEAMPIYSIILSFALSVTVIYYLYKRFTAVPPRPDSYAAVVNDEL